MEQEMWLARDEDESLYLYYGQKPVKGLYSWYNGTTDYCEIKKSSFPEVKWSDEEPTKVKLVIEK